MFKRIFSQLRIIWDFQNPEVEDLKDDNDTEKETNEMILKLNDDLLIVKF